MVLPTVIDPPCILPDQAISAMNDDLSFDQRQYDKLVSAFLECRKKPICVLRLGRMAYNRTGPAEITMDRPGYRELVC